VALAKMPVQSRNDALATVLFEVTEREDSRLCLHFFRVEAEQELSKESLLRVIGPGTTSHGPHDEGTKKSERGEIRRATTT